MRGHALEPGERLHGLNEVLGLATTDFDGDGLYGALDIAIAAPTHGVIKVLRADA